jgi:hypothetical protein
LRWAIFLKKLTNCGKNEENLPLLPYFKPFACLVVFITPILCHLGRSTTAFCHSLQFLKPMLNRKSAPTIHEVHHLVLPRPELIRLDNGIPVYVLDYPGQEIVKVEAVFRAGRPEEEKRLAARTTARLLREGTAQKKGAEIAEHLDFYGLL